MGTSETTEKTYKRLAVGVLWGKQLEKDNRVKKHFFYSKP